MPHPIVGCRDLEKTYRSATRATKVLRGVSLDVEPGAWTAIMGPSGCGKSTLLHLLGGLDVPDAGVVTIGGQDLASLSETKRAILRRRSIGYVFQFFNLVQDLTAGENVELPMLLVGASHADARHRRDELLDAVGVPGVADAVPSELSGGQQQRVAIARALANRPAVLLADEPTGNLDSEATATVLDVLRAQHDGGQTIVMVTHDAKVADAAETTLHMQDGVFAIDAPSLPTLAVR